MARPCTGVVGGSVEVVGIRGRSGEGGSWRSKKAQAPRRLRQQRELSARAQRRDFGCESGWSRPASNVSSRAKGYERGRRARAYIELTGNTVPAQAQRTPELALASL